MSITLMLMAPSKQRAQKAINSPMHSVSSNSASAQKPSPLYTCLHTPVPYSSLPCGWSQAWSLQGLLPTSGEGVQSTLCFLTTCTFPADLTLERDLPEHCCLLVLKMLLQNIHCSLLTVSLQDTLTSYCSCMNNSAFPSKHRSRLALGASLVQ